MTLMPTNQVNACMECRGVGFTVRREDRKTMNCTTCNSRANGFRPKHKHTYNYASMIRQDGKTTVTCLKCKKAEVWKI